jgi:putative flippase GtrA
MISPGETARVGRFALVGIAATALHLSVAMLLEYVSLLPVIVIHVLAYLTAFSVSFVGHYVYTFKSSRQWQQALVRFLAVSLAVLCLSSLIVKLCTIAGLASATSLLLAAFSVPALTYLLSRKLVF